MFCLFLYKITGCKGKEDLSGIYGYYIYYNQVNYEVAYTVEFVGDTVVVVILACTRENFYQTLKQYIKKW